MEKSPERLEVLKKIKEAELAGLFDQEVENDPPALAYVGRNFPTLVLRSRDTKRPRI